MDKCRMDDIECRAKKVMEVATAQQKKVFSDMQCGDERLFLMHPILKEITPKTIEKALEITVNSVEGDTSQLTGELIKYARKKGWLKGWEE